ncbi:hypothetical protein [Longimycelium tulufanense]|uniref:hypothetical protein n=1 Tax=Longimycelium tulufanense TaxID=907463 RepID=UPI00166C7D08|nr:hypothetical protein [Longimycelium tulufanense]
MTGTGAARGWGEKLRAAGLRLAVAGGIAVAAWLASSATASAAGTPAGDGTPSPPAVAEQGGRPAEAPAPAGVLGGLGQPVLGVVGGLAEGLPRHPAVSGYSDDERSTPLALPLVPLSVEPFGATGNGRLVPAGEAPIAGADDPSFRSTAHFPATDRPATAPTRPPVQSTGPDTGPDATSRASEAERTTASPPVRRAPAAGPAHPHLDGWASPAPPQQPMGTPPPAPVDRTPPLPAPDPAPRPAPAAPSVMTGGLHEGGGLRGVAGVLAPLPALPEPSVTRVEDIARSAVSDVLERRPATAPD